MVKREEPKKFYDMTDPNFRDFMYSVVLVLEPDFCQKKTIMLHELDEVN